MAQACKCGNSLGTSGPCVISCDMQSFIPSHMSSKYTVILKATFLSAHNEFLPVSQHPDLFSITVILYKGTDECCAVNNCL